MAHGFANSLNNDGIILNKLINQGLLKKRLHLLLIFDLTNMEKLLG